MMILNPLGVVADRYWRSIPEHFSNVVLGTYVIMPNHVHGIIQIVEPDRLEAAQRAAPLQQPAPQQQNNPTDRNDPMPGSLGVIVRGFKSALTKFAHGIPAYDGLRIWQRNFYDHIIRDKNDWERVHAYIITNPHRCILDRDSLDTLDD